MMQTIYTGEQSIHNQLVMHLQERIVRNLARETPSWQLTASAQHSDWLTATGCRGTASQLGHFWTGPQVTLSLSRGSAGLDHSLAGQEQLQEQRNPIGEKDVSPYRHISAVQNTVFLGRYKFIIMKPLTNNSQRSLNEKRGTATKNGAAGHRRHCWMSKVSIFGCPFFSIHPGELFNE